MDAQSTQFDSHRFVKRLTNAGLPEEVAEILADEHTRLIVPKDIATKGDVGKVEAGLEVVRGEMATKAGVGALETRVGALEAGLEVVRGEMATKGDVGALETRVGALEARLEVVRGEMATKGDVGKVEAELEVVKGEMATKADLQKVEAGLEVVKGEMATKADLHREIAASEARMEQRLRAAISEAKVSLIKWMVATMLVFSGILVGAMTSLQ